jgi:hypothetical protein
MTLVKSRPILTKALSKPDVSRLSWVKTRLDPLASLEKEIQVDFSITPNSIGIALAGDDPDELTVLVNAVRDAYVDVMERSEEETVQHFLQNQMMWYFQELCTRAEHIRDAHVAAQVRLKQAEGMEAEALKTELAALEGQMKMNMPLGDGGQLKQPEEIVKRFNEHITNWKLIAEQRIPPTCETEPAHLTRNRPWPLPR